MIRSSNCFKSYETSYDLKQLEELEVFDNL